MKLLEADLNLALLGGLLSHRLLCFPGVECWPHINLTLEYLSLISAQVNARCESIVLGGNFTSEISSLSCLWTVISPMAGVLMTTPESSGCL